MNQLEAQVQELQDKVSSLNDAKEFYDSETASSSGASHVFSQPLNIPSPRGMLSRDSGLPLDTRNSMGTSGSGFESLPAREGPSSALFENPLNLASSSCGLGSGTAGYNMKTWQRSETRAAEFVNANPTFQSGRTFSHNGRMDYPKFPISEMHREPGGQSYQPHEEGSRPHNPGGTKCSGGSRRNWATFPRTALPWSHGGQQQPWLIWKPPSQSSREYVA